MPPWTESTFFCCGKTNGRGEILDLYSHGMDRELKDGYWRSRIYEGDPITKVMVRETLSSSADGFEPGGHPKLSMLGGRAKQYWRLMNEQNVEIIGAATRRSLPGFYLVVGLHP